MAKPFRLSEDGPNKEERYMSKWDSFLHSFVTPNGDRWVYDDDIPRYITSPIDTEHLHTGVVKIGAKEAQTTTE